ncbi:MAG TPA: acetyltransferase [Levilinea sp.]|nr:acetyltransferase [Levilinea sp.]
MPKFDFDASSLIIFGGGGQGKCVIDMVQSTGVYRVAGIVDDGIPAGTHILGIPVLGGAAILPALHEKGLRLAINAIGGIGNVALRVKIFAMLAEAGFTCPSLVHPTAWVEPSAVLEGGVQILAKSYIGSAARIGYGTLINAGVIVSHDCVIGQCTNLSPGATLAGGVHVEDFAQIGMNATVNVNVIIASGARVGNGATVKADVPPGGRVYAGTTWPMRTSWL